MSETYVTFKLQRQEGYLNQQLGRGLSCHPD
jgi:hypothetical protein